VELPEVEEEGRDEEEKTDHRLIGKRRESSKDSRRRRRDISRGTGGRGKTMRWIHSTSLTMRREWL
jgi:hypothetical protein